MAAILVYSGRTKLLERLLSAVSLNVRLLKSTDGLDLTSGSNNLQEADYSGYDVLLLPPPGQVELGQDGRARLTFETVTFQHNGGPLSNVIVGYAITVPLEPPVLIWFEATASLTMANNGDTITLTPTVTLTQG